MQSQLFGQQLTFSSFAPPESAPTVLGAPAQQANEEAYNETQRGIMKEIENKQDRISELLKEIGGTEETIAIPESDELEFEPGEDIIYCKGPGGLEEEQEYLRAENEQEITTLEEEIGFLEARLK